MKKRTSGILLHITSLDSPYGIGDFGPSAYRFADFLARAGQSLWQVLPLTPVNPIYGNSPYNSISTFAGEVLLISPELMVQDGFIAAQDIKPSLSFSEGDVDYTAVRVYKTKVLEAAYQHFKRINNKSEYEKFCSVNHYWLDDFALFVALKEDFNGRVWNEWPREIRDRDKNVLYRARRKFKERIEKEKFFQYLFFKQWFSLKHYCNNLGIRFIGDLPIYVNLDSPDVWKNYELFKLDREKRPAFVAGVPPDYFSKTGQLWGNPVYRWNRLRQTGYYWWIQRIGHMLKLFDIVRIDHFRGLIACWEIPARDKTAINGRWTNVPAEDFFNTLLKRFSSLPIIAEDLGFITPDVKKVIKDFGFPGMKVLLFAFGEDNPMHPYLPHTYERNCVVYTGTHDNNTVRGWFEEEVDVEGKKRLFLYLGRKVSSEEVNGELIRLAMMSVANTVIFPMQDILGLDSKSRMNTPGTVDGNWKWRLLPEQLDSDVADRLRNLTYIYGRQKK